MLIQYIYNYLRDSMYSKGSITISYYTIYLTFSVLILIISTRIHYLLYFSLIRTLASNSYILWWCCTLRVAVNGRTGRSCDMATNGIYC